MFVSTLEKLGCELLLDELPEADEGEDDEEDDGLLDEPLDDLDVSFATARDDNAKSTAAAVMLRDFGMDETSVVVDLRHTGVQRLCRWSRLRDLLSHK